MLYSNKKMDTDTANVDNGIFIFCLDTDIFLNTYFSRPKC